MKGHWSVHPELVAAKPGLWRLAAPAIFWSKELKQAIMIPIGFETDLIVGTAAISTMLQQSQAGQMSLLMIDWLYSAKPVSKRWADKVAYEVMRASGVGFFAARAIRHELEKQGQASWDAANLPQFDRVSKLMELSKLEISDD